MKFYIIPYEVGDGLFQLIVVNQDTLRTLVKLNNKLKALEKQDERHIDFRRPEECAGLWFEPPESLENQYIRQERQREVCEALRCLTEVQARRIHAYFYEELTFREIARREGVLVRAVEKSVYSALKKMKKILEEGIQNGF